MKNIHVGIIIFFVFAANTFAREDRVPGARWTSGRGAAMGDAIIGAADDGATALFYNPAGLGSVRHFYVEPMNITILVNKDALNNLGVTQMAKVFNLNKLSITLHDNPAMRPGAGVSYFPNFVFRGLAFGMLFQSRNAAQYTEEGKIHYRTRWELIPTAGIGLRLAGGIIKLGYSIQYVNSAVGDMSTTYTGKNISYFDGIAQGSALSHNLGFIMALPTAYLPRFSAVARNMGGARYRSTSLMKVAKNPSGPPPTEKMSIDASIGLEPRVTHKTKLNMNFEYRDATNTSGTPLAMRAAIGLELGLNDFFFLRTGMAGGYPTFGLGIRRPHADINFTYYSESLSKRFRGPKEAIYMFQYQARVF